jgi:vancomycin permeability regulator SanA
MIKKAFKVTAALFSVWFLVHSTFIIADGLTDEAGASEFGVILGNKVNEDGTLSDRLKTRLDKGIQLYRDSLVRQLVVTGGHGEEGYDEGTVMADYLVRNGVPIEKIIIDNEGITTQASARNFSNLCLNATSVTVISQYYHISRTKLAFRRSGDLQVKGAHADYFEIRDIYSLIREFFGYYKYLFSS